MIEWVGPIARWLHLISGALAFGAMWWLTRGTLTANRQNNIWRSLPWLLILFIGTALVVLAGHTAQALGTTGFSISLSEVSRFAFQTQFGNVWLGRLIVAALLLIYLFATRSRAVIATLIVVGILQASLALAGHGVASDAPILAQVCHAAHVLAASAWLGGLATMLSGMATTRLLDNVTRSAKDMRVFSEFALSCMIVIVMSGIAIAALQIQSWPGLFGTNYGERLLIKIALLLAALAIAAHLRWRTLKTIDVSLADPTKRRNLAQWLAVELIFAIAIIWMAASLAVTPPAQHEQINWPFAFRIAPEVTWPKPDLQAQFWWGLAIIAAGIAWMGWSWRQFGLHRRDVLLGIAVAGLGVWIAIPALSVPAFPDTYRRSSVPYQSISIGQGQRLFAQHCVNCHGIDATGNGALAKSLPKPPADLTAPHTGDHTAGDMFWWLTHGMANTGMPAFPQLSEEDRWDLVNFVHTLATGYEARVIRERIVPMRPWLGAPDFNYVANDGSSGSLKHFRERGSVLLILFSEKSSARLEQLSEVSSTLAKFRTQIIAVPLESAPISTTKFAFPIISEGGEDIARSYQLLRRTIENPRLGERAPRPTHMEFLIDRYGYLRGRWLPEDTEPGWRDKRNLVAQVEQLAREPRVKPPPDEHLH